STGGMYEYAAASDFDVPFASILRVSQLRVAVVKGESPLTRVNVHFLGENQGIPGEVLHAFENMIPTSQDLTYTTESDEFSGYEIVVDFPETFDLTKGKYFIMVQAEAEDGTNMGWELNGEETTTVGRFDFAKFEDED